MIPSSLQDNYDSPAVTLATAHLCRLAQMRRKRDSLHTNAAQFPLHLTLTTHATAVLDCEPAGWHLHLQWRNTAAQHKISTAKRGYCGADSPVRQRTSHLAGHSSHSSPRNPPSNAMPTCPSQAHGRHAARDGVSRRVFPRETGPSTLGAPNRFGTELPWLVEALSREPQHRCDKEGWPGRHRCLPSDIHGDATQQRAQGPAGRRGAGRPRRGQRRGQHTQSPRIAHTGRLRRRRRGAAECGGRGRTGHSFGAGDAAGDEHRRSTPVPRRACWGDCRAAGLGARGNGGHDERGEGGG